MGKGKRWNAVAEARLYTRAAHSHGVLHRDQILAAGMSEVTLRRRVKSGWKELLPDVFRLLPPPKSAYRQSLMAACLWGGPNAAVSHGAAAVLHGLEDESDASVEITIAQLDPKRRSSGRAPPWVKLHRMIFDPDVEVLRVDGIPVTTPTRTLLDLASFKSEDEVDSAMDKLLREKQTSAEQLDRFLPDAACRGRRGLRRLRKVHLARGGTKAKDSEAERLFLKNVIRANGLPEPVHNKRIWVGGKFYKPDFSYPELGVVIEIHSYKHHLGSRSVADAHKQNEMVRLGLTPLVFWWEDVKYKPDETAEIIRQTCSLAMSRLR